MNLGEKIRQARQEAGLSQRQACGEFMTRNMLSLIENGSARPSMATLQYLSQVLGKPMSWFLEETTVTSPNQALMAQARTLWDQGQAEALGELLQSYCAPDPVFDREAALLRYLAGLSLAEKALAENRAPYARSLLEACDNEIGAYITEPLRLKRLQLGQLAGEAVGGLPLDGYLYSEASRETDPKRAVCLVGAMRVRDPKAELLLGKSLLALKRYAQALPHLQKADALPEAWPALELCHKELGDYQKAYEYAVKQRK